MDNIAADLVISGLRGQAKRLRRFRTEMTNFVNSEKHIPAKSPAHRDALTGAAAALAAAISLLERTPAAKKAAPSNRMFAQMLDDYRRALEAARAELRLEPALPKRRRRKTPLFDLVMGGFYR